MSKTARPSPWSTELHGEDRALETAFAGCSTIGAPAAARLLGMDIKTLRRHVDAGHLVGRLKGLGQARQHRVFTRADLTRFLQLLTEDAPCPSSAPKVRPTGNLISGSTVIAFPAPRDYPMNVKLQPSKAGKKQKPAKSSTESDGPTAPR